MEIWKSAAQSSRHIPHICFITQLRIRHLDDLSNSCISKNPGNSFYCKDELRINLSRMCILTQSSLEEMFPVLQIHSKEFSVQTGWSFQTAGPAPCRSSQKYYHGKLKGFSHLILLSRIPGYLVS